MPCIRALIDIIDIDIDVDILPVLDELIEFIYRFSQWKKPFYSLLPFTFLFANSFI